MPNPIQASNQHHSQHGEAHNPQSAQFANSIPPHQDPKKSVMGNYDIRPVQNQRASAQDHSTWNIILVSDNNQEPAKLILTANIRDKYLKYNYLKDVVDYKSQLKPSLYHRPEEAGILEVDKQLGFAGPKETGY